MPPVGLSNLDRRYQKLAKQEDFLIRLNTIVPWEEFRPLLTQIRQKPRKSKAGRKPLDNETKYAEKVWLGIIRPQDSHLALTWWSEEIQATKPY